MTNGSGKNTPVAEVFGNGNVPMYIQAAKNFWKKVKEDIHVSNKSQGYMIKCYGQHCKYCMYTFDPDLPLMRAPKRNAEFARQIKCKYSFVASTYVAITASLD